MSALYGVAYHSQEPLALQRLQAQLEVQQELDSAGVGGVAGGCWPAWPSLRRRRGCPGRAGAAGGLLG
jgi:hypothetical protein